MPLKTVLEPTSNSKCSSHISFSLYLSPDHRAQSFSLSPCVASREDDDINDVASMAGVNLSEENAQILTTVVGSVVQSCQDQLFLSPNLLLSRILRAGTNGSRSFLRRVQGVFRRGSRGFRRCSGGFKRDSREFRKVQGGWGGGGEFRRG